MVSAVSIFNSSGCYFGLSLKADVSPLLKFIKCVDLDKLASFLKIKGFCGPRFFTSNVLQASVMELAGAERATGGLAQGRKHEVHFVGFHLTLPGTSMGDPAREPPTMWRREVWFKNSK